MLPCRSAYERRTRCRHGRAMHMHAAHTPFPCVSSRYAHGLLVHGAWTHCQRVASQMSVRAPSGTQSQGLQSLPRAGVGRTPPGSAQPGSRRCRAPRGRGAPCRPLSSGVAVPQCPWCSLRLTARMFPWGGAEELALHDACERVRSLKRPDAAGLWYVYSAFSMEAADLYSRRIFHCSFNKMRKYLL